MGAPPPQSILEVIILDKEKLDALYAELNQAYQALSSATLIALFIKRRDVYDAILEALKDVSDALIKLEVSNG